YVPPDAAGPFEHGGHCGIATLSGLGRSVYDTPPNDAQYPPVKRTSARPTLTARVQDVRPIPAEPTPARPGTPEKVAELRRRAERGEALWHPADADADAAGRGTHYGPRLLAHVVVPVAAESA